MTVTALQTDIVWNDIPHNLATAEQLIKDSAGAALYVLPEMFSTGFITQPDGNAEPEGGTTLQWMLRMAKETQAAITGSVAVQTSQGDYRNRMYFVKPDGTFAYYDKHHLFTYAGEHQHYIAGSEPVIVLWRGVRIMLQVCYDLRFPCFSRNNSKPSTLNSKPSTLNSQLSTPYDLCIYVASWPESRRAVWDVLLRARAIENQCYVIGVNRIGDDPVCHYNGGTTIISPYGKVDATAPDDAIAAITSPLDLERLHAFRQKFPVLNDADSISLK